MSRYKTPEITVRPERQVVPRRMAHFHIDAIVQAISRPRWTYKDIARSLGTTTTDVRRVVRGLREMARQQRIVEGNR